MDRPFFRWLFYGHVWIALAAAALGWQSTYLNDGDRSLRWEHIFLFLATLGVYTLHRLLSFYRANGAPTALRYGLVRRYPMFSMGLGVASLIAAAVLLLLRGPDWLYPVLFALPFTLFYLIPVYPGGPRLRDLPYLKVVWVALSWTFLTHFLPVSFHGPALFEPVYRFAFTLSVALLFDLRDVELDRRQGVKTVATRSESLSRIMAISLLICCALVALVDYPRNSAIPLTVAYLAGAFIGYYTHTERSEDWYAIYVNGMLLLPPTFLFLFG